MFGIYNSSAGLEVEEMAFPHFYSKSGSLMIFRSDLNRIHQPWRSLVNRNRWLAASEWRWQETMLVRLQGAACVKGGNLDAVFTFDRIPRGTPTDRRYKHKTISPNLYLLFALLLFCSSSLSHCHPSYRTWSVVFIKHWNRVVLMTRLFQFSN